MRQGHRHGSTRAGNREYHLHLEYWIPPGGNSGLSMRDGSRAHNAIRERDSGRAGAWNSMEIESRDASIRVRLNGQVVAESPGDPARSKSGPIGLQLHDQFTMAMFRNIRIRER